MKQMFENFDFGTAVLCSMLLLGIVLFVLSIFMAISYESFWPFMLWVPAIVCFAIVAGLDG